eukprot:220755-Ditylum_brightwellii.AAC.1
MEGPFYYMAIKSQEASCGIPDNPPSNLLCNFYTFCSGANVLLVYDLDTAASMGIWMESSILEAL